jgi:hypothetical protein
MDVEDRSSFANGEADVGVAGVECPLDCVGTRGVCVSASGGWTAWVCGAPLALRASAWGRI